MLSKSLSEDQLINAISIIASSYGCRIVDIDFANHTINLEGSPESEISCAVEIEKVLGEYLEDAQPAGNEYGENGHYGNHSLVA